MSWHPRPRPEHLPPPKTPLDAMRPEQVAAHRGSVEDFLARFRHEAKLACKARSTGRQKIAPHLFALASDERMLFAALQHLRQDGGKAPGPRGLTYDNDFADEHSAWEWCRSLRDEIRDGHYEPWEERVCQIPKGKGRGHRELVIQEIPDRLVQRAAFETLDGLLEPLFMPLSFGFRPGRNRLQALAAAEKLKYEFGFSFWATDDIRDAFCSVPIPRLLQVVRRYLQSSDMTAHVKAILSNSLRPGLRQGGALSPVLLNLYLHHFLDLKWHREAEGGTPLFRYADDLLIVAKSDSKIRKAHEHLRQVLLPAGMRLKGEGQVCRLGARTQVEWLGFLVSAGPSEFNVKISEHAWEKLRDSLEVCAAESDLFRGPGGNDTQDVTVSRARSIIAGSVNEFGPAGVNSDAVDRMTSLIASTGFAGLYQPTDLAQLLQKAYARWCKIRNTRHVWQLARCAAGLTRR